MLCLFSLLNSYMSLIRNYFKSWGRFYLLFAAITTKGILAFRSDAHCDNYFDNKVLKIGLYKWWHVIHTRTFIQFLDDIQNISLPEWIFKLRFVVLSLLFPFLLAIACTINLNKMFMRDQIITIAPPCLYQVSQFERVTDNGQ